MLEMNLMHYTYAGRETSRLGNRALGPWFIADCADGQIFVLAVEEDQWKRLVDFMGSYPPGDVALGELRGPMADATVSWLNRVALGVPTQAATAAEAHDRLMLTKALDLSAKRKQAVKLPLEPEEGRRAA